MPLQHSTSLLPWFRCSFGLAVLQRVTIKHPSRWCRCLGARFRRRSIALGILKQTAKKAGFDADVQYLNIDFAKQAGV